MPETVSITFQFALGARVRWTESARAWRVIERYYREEADGCFVRYGLQAESDAMKGIAGEAFLMLWEEGI